MFSQMRPREPEMKRGRTGRERVITVHASASILVFKRKGYVQF